MNFITFSTAFTNLWPAANATDGGQLMTEFNVRSRETVATDPNVVYSIGPSYTHGEKDFYVGVLSDAGGLPINNYTLSISEGRAVINGHYVETLAPMTIDLVEANAKLELQSRPLLQGELAIGIRTFYSTESTVAGSILITEDSADPDDPDSGQTTKDMFIGIQLVILPVAEMISPSDSPSDKSKVTVDLKLATFTFLNNRISALRNSETKTQYIPFSRITALDSVMSTEYVTKKGLNSKKIYAFAGKGVNPSTGADTWEDVTDSLIIWDADPQRTLIEPVYREAQIVPDDTNQQCYFILPHKQVTGMTDDQGDYEYYAPRVMSFPIADYASNSIGFVTKDYTKQIKYIANQIDQMKVSVQGKQVYFMDKRETTDTELPEINPDWKVGDYILVRQDFFYAGDDSDTESAPATMYVVLPGLVTQVRFITSVDGDAVTPAEFPSNIGGIELGHQEWYQSTGKPAPETQVPEYYPEFYDDEDQIRGIPKNTTTGEWFDYFRIRYYKENSPTYAYTDYYYGVTKTDPREWSDAVLVTGSVALATEETIGGFLNASEDAVDYGYVIVDDTGHLKLLDYDLLRSGTLAYQIGANITVPASDDLSEIQNYLNEYVNDRIAFPQTSAATPYFPVIDITITLPESDTGGTLEIHGIDSRFNTAVRINVLGEASYNVALNISDCEKLMINPSIQGSPVINIFRCNLYYDPVVLGYIKECIRDTSVYGTYTGFRDLKLWYEKLSSTDPSLVVNNLTVSELDSPIIATDISYWKDSGSAINDNNYLVALKSITFSGDGEIIGCSVLAANNSTDNISPGNKIIVGNFILPQGETLIYPIACLTRKLKVTGTFTTAYRSDNIWYVTDNSMTMITGVYSPTNTDTAMTGTVAFHSTTTLVPNTLEQESIEPWATDSFNIFSGGAIS